MNTLYHEQVIEHATNPHNFGELKKYTHRIRKDNTLCGDSIQIDIKEKGGIVEDIRFIGWGCAISKASASLLTDYAKGKSIFQLRKIRPPSIMKMIGIQLGPNRMKCALLPLEALHELLSRL